MHNGFKRHRQQCYQISKKALPFFLPVCYDEAAKMQVCFGKDELDEKISCFVERCPTG